MSRNTILSVASVTAVLKSLLDNMLVRQLAQVSLGDVMVTALSPDRIQVGAEERTQLNLYLYRITPNSGRYRSGTAGARESSAATLPLALDLHYLLSAYGERELHAEMLLGCAIECLQENQVLPQEQLRSLLASIASAHGSGGPNPILELLAASSLADEVQPLKISPEFLNTEEMSRLWSSLQAHARPSMTYQVSMVLLGGEQGVMNDAPTIDRMQGTLR